MSNMKHLIFKLFTCLLTGMILACSTSCRKQQPVKMAYLQITTEPQNASVFIYGEERAKKLRVRPGIYILKFSCPNYKDAWIKVEAQLGKTYKIHQIMEPETADVMIISTPPKVQVSFKGKKMGMTPLVLRDLQFGSYSAEISKSGYAPRTVSWKVKSAAPQQIKANLASNLGKLYVISEPQNAEVLIDGAVVGRTPFKEDVEAGKRKIIVRYTGYMPAYREVFVKEQQTVRLDGIKLEAKRSSMNITSNPSQAKVTINGNVLGNTPLKLSNLKPGKYRLVLAKESFDETEREITLLAGTHQDVKIELSNNTGGADITTQPAGLTIYLDGERLGVTKPDRGNSRFSQVFKIRNRSAGTHELVVFHKRGNPTRKKYTFSIKKGEIKLMKNVHLWVPNAVVTYLHDNSQTEGRLVQVLNDSYLFEPSPGIQDSIRKKDVTIKLLDMND